MNVHRLRAREDDIPLRFAPPPIAGQPAAFEPPARLGLQVLRVRFGLIVGLVAAAMAMAAFLVLRLPSTYTASTSILLSVPPDKARSNEAIATVENQIQILTSTPFAQRVVKKLNLERDEEFTGAKQSNGLVGMLFSLLGLRERVAVTGLPQGAVDPIILKRFAAKLEVEAQGRSTVLHISFSSAGPAKAATIANAIAALYLAEQSATRSAAPDDHVAQLAAQARADQNALAQYKAANPFGNVAATVEQPSDQSQQILAARTNVATQEAKFRQLNTLFHSGGIEAVLPLIASPTMTQLREQQAELVRKEAELSTKYGDKHPQMIALKADRAAIDKKIDEDVRRHIQNQGGQLNAARARLTALEQGQSAASTAPLQAGDGRLQELERRAETSRAAYQAALAGGAAAGDAAVDEQTQVPQARQIDPAVAPRLPTSPNRPLILGATFGASLLLAVLLAFWLERPRNAFRGGREIEAMSRVPNFAVVPSAGGRRGTVERVVRKPRSSFAEAIRSLHAGLQLLRGGPPKVLLVTSSVPDEGKTSVAVALGRLVARSGARVILVDCDLRHPSIAEQFSAQQLDAGLADVLTGGCDLATILRRDPLSPLEFLPVAAPSANPAELISSQALKNLIEVLRLHYDLVILDAAPVLPVADTRLLSRLADKALYVVEWNKTPREAVLSGIAMLRNAGTEVAGTVLNKADMRRHAMYGYGFSGRSHGYGGRYYAE